MKVSQFDADKLQWSQLMWCGVYSTHRYNIWLNPNQCLSDIWLHITPFTLELNVQWLLQKTGIYMRFAKGRPVNAITLAW